MMIVDLLVDYPFFIKFIQSQKSFYYICLSSITKFTFTFDDNYRIQKLFYYYKIE